MTFKSITNDELQTCAELLMRTYNCPPWNDRWTAESALRYVSEFFGFPRFFGFAAFEGDELVGAMFCREHTWYTNDELYVDEFFIAPEHQRKGYGAAMLKYAEDYIKSKGLAGFTLLTNRYMPAPRFYEKNGFTTAEHVMFMYKEV
ncbi:GNAT family N-acetyltransferase [Acetanaerobacterium elongatum]|uniref:Ribosomal protein S18 acetylase RimI n=1 Tax=Acetanaerobacterium elongatum TaxID=258515 RepID=A0A1G9W8K6_9FIRM|nr:GNAT family N-acetyltransferase [Acetanaerobacterium elongatum]SDM80868.1 Ribosomal protein S18 acetylase RimI [Acetanaerobacterium elongatum]